MKYAIIIISIFLSGPICKAQFSHEFKGQNSGILNYSPDNERPLLASFRTLPEAYLKYTLDTFSKIDFKIALNANLLVDSDFRDLDAQGELDPYRFWMRYSTKQMELRMGLQKIEFGSASILRPLQWFNQIDPRDPLQLTNGVWGVLGRYYFLNNANIWLWGLYGNDEQKGFEVFSSVSNIPEYGGRIQYPVKKGEIAINYHHRSADVRILQLGEDNTAENRIAIDGKWDLGVGLWFELMHSWKAEQVGIFKHSTFATLGSDYTFGVGNGLNVSLEYMFVGFSEEFAMNTQTSQLFAFMVNYPFGLFDSITGFSSYNLESNNYSIFLNYQHQFSRLNGYLMLFYNSGNNNGINQNDLVYNFSGPGIRIMTVYKY